MFSSLSLVGHSPGALAVNNMVSVSTGLFFPQTWGISLLFWHTHIHALTVSIQASSLSSTSHTIKHWNVTLSCVLCVHYRGCMAWLSVSYAWGNFSVLAVGVWAIAQRDSIDAVLMVSLCIDSFMQAAILASCDTYRSLTIGTAMRIHANLFVCGIWDILRASFWDG